MFNLKKKLKKNQLKQLFKNNINKLRIRNKDQDLCVYKINQILRIFKKKVLKNPKNHKLMKILTRVNDILILI